MTDTVTTETVQQRMEAAQTRADKRREERAKVKLAKRKQLQQMPVKLVRRSYRARLETLERILYQLVAETKHAVQSTTSKLAETREVIATMLRVSTGTASADDLAVLEDYSTQMAPPPVTPEAQAEIDKALTAPAAEETPTTDSVPPG